MNDNTNRVHVSIGSELLQVVFIVLKLMHVIDWSWWWVLAPTWIPVVLILILLLIAFILHMASYHADRPPLNPFEWDSTKQHHIWCNYFMRPREGCSLCERLYREYPMDKSPDEMMKEYFPDVIVRPGT